MYDVLNSGSDSVITIGGIQSNHCRAVAAACSVLGVESHLILRTDAEHGGKLQDPGYLFASPLPFSDRLSHSTTVISKVCSLWAFFFK